MTVAPILAVGIIMKIVGVLFVLSCILLILVVLIQKGRGGGLSSAFGGGMGGGLLGSKTGDFLTWLTIGMVCVFLLLAIVTAKYYRTTVSEYESIDGGQDTSTDVNAPAAPPVAPIDSGAVPAPVDSGTVPAPLGDEGDATNTGGAAPLGGAAPVPVNEPGN